VNRWNKYQVEWNEYDAEAAKNIMSSFLNSGMTARGISERSASILFTFANPVYPDPMDSVNPTLQKTINALDHSNLVKNIRILGLMALISYMIVILFTWIFANIEGYIYFSAGEPVLFIKYLEWILGLLGIFVAVNYLKKELNGYIL
jgi:hypothetical protein